MIFESTKFFCVFFSKIFFAVKECIVIFAVANKNIQPL